MLNLPHFSSFRHLTNATRKVFHRFERSFQNESRYREWLSSHETTFDRWADGLSQALCREAMAFEKELYAFAKTQDFPAHMGGNAYVRLLYFLAKYIQPETVVETGVSIGYSSQALLSALDRNGKGQLYSSELQYLHDNESHRYIGLLVSAEFKDRWTLLTKGDRINLAQIAQQVNRINLFHYDSDKSISGRIFACNIALERMSKGDVIVLDDVNDNDHLLSLSNLIGRAPAVFTTKYKSIGLFMM
jgi:predicted O-methyltransferase YrrM